MVLKAVDSQGMLKQLGIDFSTDSDDNFLRLTLFLYGVCGRIYTVVHSIMNVLPMAWLAIVYPEHGAALEDLKALYCADNPPLFPGKSFENQIFALRDEVALISLSASKYMNLKCPETLLQHGSELKALPLLLSEKEENFSDRNDVLQLNYDLTGMGDISGELCWAVKALLNESSLAKVLPKDFDYFCTLIKDDTETVGAQHLIALLLSLASSYLPRLGINENILTVLQRYRDYLIGSACSPSDGVIEKLKEFLISRRDVSLERFDNAVAPTGNAILSKGDMLLLSKHVFIHTAEKCGTTKATLANILKDAGILQGNNSGNMRNIRFGDTTERMYAIDCSVLFDIGELRPMCADYNAPESSYHIPIGKADEYDIYYDIYPFDGKRNNPFALITGATGTGKSTLCTTLADNAAELGMSVVILSLETSALDVECTAYEPGEDIEVSLDLFFEELKGGLNENETVLADTASELMRDQDYTSYDEILTELRELVTDEPNAENLLVAAQQVTDKLSGFSWDKVVVNGKIFQIIAESPEDADKLLLEFFNYKAAQAEKRTTLLLIDEVQELSWDGKSPLVSKILRQGRKHGIAGVFSTQYLNADSGKNIASALKQIGTHFAFRPSDDIAALKQLGYSSSDSRARDTLHSLDTGEVLAKGNISTDICPLDYPVKFTVIPNGET